MATVSEVDARLSGHEDVCAERYSRIELQFDATNARLKRIEKVMMTTAGTIILLLLGIVLKIAGLS